MNFFFPSIIFNIIKIKKEYCHIKGVSIVQVGILVPLLLVLTILLEVLTFVAVQYNYYGYYQWSFGFYLLILVCLLLLLILSYFYIPKLSLTTHMDSSHSTLTLQSNVGDWLVSPVSASSSSPVPLSLSTDFFNHENDSVETITMDNRHRRVSNSNMTVGQSGTPRSGFMIPASAVSSSEDNRSPRDGEKDDISKCISNLNLYDLLNSTITQSSSENSSSDISDVSEVEMDLDHNAIPRNTSQRANKGSNVLKNLTSSGNKGNHHETLGSESTGTDSRSPSGSPYPVTSTVLSTNSGTSSSSTAANQNTNNIGRLYKQTSHPPILKKLKSSLKLSSSSSQSSISSNKSVRFASELTKVKCFDSSMEPVTISNETSPQISPLDRESPHSHGSSSSTSYSSNIGSRLDPSDSFWFGTQLSKMNLPLSKSIPKFSLSDSDNDLEDSDSDFDLDHLNDPMKDNYCYLPTNYPRTLSTNSNSNSTPSSSSNSNTFSHYGFMFKTNNSNDTMAENVYDSSSNANKFNKNNIDYNNGFNFNLNASPTKDSIQIKSWILKDTNIKKFYPTSMDLNRDLGNYLQGSNIKLHECNSLQLSQGKLTGLIYVANLSFEKFIEIKFSFNDWKDIHYVTANYKRTITDTIDEFQFVINLSSFVYFLKVKNLILHDTLVSPIKIHLCCRYDVNGETYYDNNNYENYKVSLDAITNVRQKSKRKTSRPRLLKSSAIMKRSLSSDNFVTDFSNKSTPPSDPAKAAPPKLGRRFSEDTDYFNSSPLKNVSANYTTAPLNQNDPKYDELIKSYCFYDPNAASKSRSHNDFNIASSSSTNSRSESVEHLNSSFNSNSTLIHGFDGATENSATTSKSSPTINI